MRILSIKCNIFEGLRKKKIQGQGLSRCFLPQISIPRNLSDLDFITIGDTAFLQELIKRYKNTPDMFSIHVSSKVGLYFSTVWWICLGSEDSHSTLSLGFLLVSGWLNGTTPFIGTATHMVCVCKLNTYYPFSHVSFNLTKPPGNSSGADHLRGAR